MCKLLKNFFSKLRYSLTSFKSFCWKHKSIILIVIVLFSVGWFIATILFFKCFPDFLHASETLKTISTNIDKNPMEEINAWFYFLSGAGTAALAVIAYFKIGDINKQNEDSFLLYIDERWGSPEVLKAREIIHTLYRETQEEHKDLVELLPEKSEDYHVSKERKRPQNYVERLYKENQEKIKELEIPLIKSKDAFIQAVIGIKILKISRNTTMTNNFIYLLNFLDFMDTISYLAKGKNDEFVYQLDDLCGDSLVFNYKIFEPYIAYKRQKHEKRRARPVNKERKFYGNFEDLYNKLTKDEESKI